MIDIEVDVYDGLYSLLAKECPDVFLSGELVRAPSSFPSVTMMEADNYVATDTQDSGSNENHVKVMYEVAVYSNRATDPEERVPFHTCRGGQVFHRPWFHKDQYQYNSRWRREISSGRFPLYRKGIRQSHNLQEVIRWLFPLIRSS